VDPSQISQDTLLGKLLRLPFKVIPPGAAVRVVRGPARGMRWIAGSTTRGFWLGYWEMENQRLFASRLRPGDVVYDIGAHVGLYTLISSSHVHEEGHVYAFEPLPRNLQFLRRHIELNKISNCTIVEAAVSDRSGWQSFDPTVHDSAGHLSETGGVRVATITIDEFLSSAEFKRPPNILKINAEGAEVEVLTGAQRALSDFSPLIFLSTHSNEINQKCQELLRSSGYSATSLAIDKIWAERKP